MVIAIRTIKINFSLDKKGKLENNSLDLLLPLYDNKTDWLLFSQSGYRNKDSRHTLNLGLGGRYFDQNWMYGINTFYDHDITGKNRRLGLGGELWSDYIKLSANAYYRLSNWRNSHNFQDYYERPANGYDINGEFFLPAYPNLGAKLSYERYFGDNVTLFDSKTKQKNPAQATIGLTYTPIPLITLGSDYKQGTESHTELQFQANLNLKLGASLSEQLSPDNVVSMRKLAGSRYDLVERNNNIVLDHRKIPLVQFSIPKVVIGYTGLITNIPLKIFGNISNEKINWSISNEKNFSENGGTLSYNSKNLEITFPNYIANEINTYTASIYFDLGNGSKTESQKLQIIVQPFTVLKEDNLNYSPPGPLIISEKEGYIFNPKITFDNTNNTNIIKNFVFNKVVWETEPSVSEQTKLRFYPSNEFTKVEINENGDFLKEFQPTLISEKYTGDVKVYVMIDNQPKQLVNIVKFDKNNLSITKSPKSNKSLVYSEYTYTVKITDSHGAPIKQQKVVWNSNKDINSGFNFINQDSITNNEGQASATITSSSKLDVIISATINNDTISANSVDFNWPVVNSLVSDKTPNSAYFGEKYILTASIDDLKNNPNSAKFQFKWDFTPNNPDISLQNVKTSIDSNGQLTAELVSNPTEEPSTDINVCINVIGDLDLRDQKCLSTVFIGKPKDYVIDRIEVSPSEDLTADNDQAYTYKAYIVDKDNKNNPAAKVLINNVTWSKDKDITGLDLIAATGKVTTDENGVLTAKLQSNSAIDDVMVSLSIPSMGKVNAKRAVSFKEANINIEFVPKEQLIYGEYLYTITATDFNKVPLMNRDVTWSLKESNPNVILQVISSKTDSKGQATAKLKSINQTSVSNLIVIASIDGIIKLANSTSFKLPEIKDIIATKASDPQYFSDYLIVATIDETITKDFTNIKFDWSVLLEDGTENPNIILKNSIDQVSNGQLTALLTDTSEKPETSKVKVCINVRSNSNPPKKCVEVLLNSESQNYYVDRIEVSPSEDLTADTDEFYTYKAYIYNKITKKPVFKTDINNVTWSKDKDIIGLDLIAATGKVTTDENGVLTAKLQSNSAIDDVMVSLSIEDKGKTPANPVSFKQMQIHIESEPKEKQLIYGEYLYTTTVTDSNNAAIEGIPITWSLKDSNPNVMLQIISSKTDSKGQATAKLKSITSTPITNIVVEASSPSKITKEANPVEFELPIIKSVKIINNGTAVPGGNYQIEAYILDNYGKGYSGNKIKFDWLMEKQIKGLSLNPTDSVIVSNGIVKTTLYSNQTEFYPDENTSICLVINGNPPLTEDQKKTQWSEITIFKPLPFLIDNLEVGIYDSNGNFTTNIPKPLLGDDKSFYIYRAKISLDNKPLTDYKIKFSSGKGWSKNLENISTNKLVLTKDSKYPNNFDKTDNEGYLHASLKSQVGVNGVIVTLAYNDIAKSATEVQFYPYPKQAALKLFNSIIGLNSGLTPEPATHYNPNSTELPVNSFTGLSAYLVDINGNFIVNSNKIKVDFHSSNESVVSIGSDDIVTFQDKGIGKYKLSATITYEDNTMDLYEYPSEIKRYFYLYSVQNPQSPNGSWLNEFNSDLMCESGNQITPVAEDVSDSTKIPVPLMSKYPDLSAWFLLPNDNGSWNMADWPFHNTDSSFKVYIVDKSNNKYNYEIFHFTGNIESVYNPQNTDTSGYTLCVIK
ncbi:MAG: inverse autotransporter beta domain-containing protein [Enterobacteriaceae bacterium]|jgi:adhesin/invasin|nr:inverse autotransporter beta domain-containing protein [Enterobacteriaceae bacterium]